MRQPRPTAASARPFAVSCASGAPIYTGLWLLNLLILLLPLPLPLPEHVEHDMLVVPIALSSRLV